MEIDREWSKQKTITTTVQQIRELEDKKGRKFLVLQVANSDKSILVFHRDIKEPEWSELLVGSEYVLTVKENRRGDWKLAGFANSFTF